MWWKTNKPTNVVAVAKNKLYDNLFESCILIGLTYTVDPTGEKVKVPYVKDYFPHHVKPPGYIELFCFPDADSWTPLPYCHEPEDLHYSLVLTDDQGNRKFGYCRRVLPEGSDLCVPLVYCIVSRHRASGFYYKILQQLQSMHGSPGLEKFKCSLYESRFPKPGQKFTKILEQISKFTVKSEETMPPLLRRPPDVRIEDRDLSLLMGHLTIPVLLKAFASLLMETRILLIGKSSSVLSSCIEGLQSILFPFSWQHSCIPVLPAKLHDLWEAPTPYLFGILKKSISQEGENILENFNNVETIIDIDSSKIIKCSEDVNNFIPSRLSKNLQSALKAATTRGRPSSEDLGLYISDAFIRFFIDVFGHYNNHIKFCSDGTKRFELNQFIEAVNSATTRCFLKRLMENAMFQNFIQERLQYDNKDLFWRRCNEFINGARRYPFRRSWEIVTLPGK